jgi:hypothetical protein
VHFVTGKKTSFVCPFFCLGSKWKKTRFPFVSRKQLHSLFVCSFLVSPKMKKKVSLLLLEFKQKKKSNRHLLHLFVLFFATDTVIVCFLRGILFKDLEIVSSFFVDHCFFYFTNNKHFLCKRWSYFFFCKFLLLKKMLDFS